MDRGDGGRLYLAAAGAANVQMPEGKTLYQLGSSEKGTTDHCREEAHKCPRHVLDDRLGGEP